MPIAHVPLDQSLVLAAVLFLLGLLGVLARRDMIWILMCLEIMLNAAALVFVSAGARWHQPDGQVFFILILAVAAANVSVGLALILRLFRRNASLDADALRELRDGP